MRFEFNRTGAERKALVQAMGEILGVKPRYLGMPTAAYEVDYFHIDRAGAVEFDDRADSEEIENLMERLAERGIQKCIGENARVAQNQGEYAKRYDALVERFETAKARLEEVQAAITEKQAQRKLMENFMEVLRGLPEQVDYFDEAAWYAMVDFVTVYGKEDVRFTFKNGMEISV